MNYVQRASKSLRIGTALVLAMFVVAVAATAIPAQAQTLTVLYEATGDPGIAIPQGLAIALGRNGQLYTTDLSTGAFQGVFSFTTAGAVTLVNNVGGGPYAGVTLGTDGNFYGATVIGGANGVGTVYKVTPKGVLTVLHSFTGNADGDFPVGPPIEATDGTFYGTTSSIGVPNSTAYSVTSKGVFKTIHTFTGSDGQNVDAPLVQGTDGDFYGVAVAGGANNMGVVFKMTSSGAVTVLHSFTGTDGCSPSTGLIQASDGNFYGTAPCGGDGGSAGVIFKITSGGDYSVLYNSPSGDTSPPNSSLVQGTDGKLYGVTASGSSGAYGTIYNITTTGTFTLVHTFVDTDGDNPSTPLRQDPDGKFYGATSNGGGACECGVLYSLDMGLGPFVSLMSTSGKELSAVEILGQGFSKSSVVEFGGVAATKIAVTGSTYISATVPAGALTGSVTVTTGGTTLTSTKTFSVLPTVKEFTPPSGPVGTAVTITGTGLTQTTKVTFDGVAATKFTVNLDTQVTADVPTGGKTGKIAVTTKGGSASSSAKFTVN